MSTPAIRVEPEELMEELQAELDLYVRLCPAEPTFQAPPVVLPAGPGRFALRDPGSVNETQPNTWNAGHARTGVATRGATHVTAKMIPGRPYPKSHPMSRIFTADELEQIRNSVDTDEGSPLGLAHERSETLYREIRAAAAGANLDELRTAFVVRFLTAKLGPGYFAEATDEARKAHLDRHLRHALAAVGLKEQMIADYEKRIAEAETAQAQAIAEARAAASAVVAAPQVVRLAPKPEG